jgi:hypothetical protein
MKAFFDMMDKQPRKVMILGGSCTSVTDPIAKTSKHWRIPVVSNPNLDVIIDLFGYSFSLSLNLTCHLTGKHFNWPTILLEINSILPDRIGIFISGHF